MNVLRRQRGFSLIEVIAAFLIFALGFGVLLQILTSSLRVAQRSEDYTQAALWAQSLLDVVGIGEPLEEGHERGRFDERYSWELEIVEISPPEVAGNDEQNLLGLEENLPIELYQLDLLVTWGPPQNESQARFATIRAVDSAQAQMFRMNSGVVQ